MEADLHVLARAEAERLIDPDRKQLRFNAIVDAALAFYPGAEALGVSELVQACDRSNAALYVKNRPMWRTLTDEYGWMRGGKPSNDGY